jgi:hypothetical protein
MSRDSASVLVDIAADDSAGGAGGGNRDVLTVRYPVRRRAAVGSPV